MADAGANAGTLGGGDWKPLDVTDNRDINTRTQSGWK
jgi:chromosome segregation ATPase